MPEKAPDVEQLPIVPTFDNKATKKSREKEENQNDHLLTKANFLVIRQLGIGSRFGGISDLFAKIIGLFGPSEINNRASQQRFESQDEREKKYIQKQYKS